jgi:hypothetical protein
MAFCCGMAQRDIRKSKRSGTRPCDACERVLILVEHHIGGREIPDAEAAWNKAWICASCHDEVHAGLKIIEGWFKTSQGKKLFWHWKGEQPKLVEGVSVPTYGD